MYDNEFETKENKIWTKDKIEPQHMHDYERVVIRSNFFRRGQYLDFFSSNKKFLSYHNSGNVL